MFGQLDVGVCSIHTHCFLVGEFKHVATLASRLAESPDFNGSNVNAQICVD
jgi:hypothetical protein